MNIVKENPPNFTEISQYLNPSEEAVYCHGDTIYNPSDRKLTPDVIEHEKVHQRQQAEYSSVDIWWNKYLLDSQFRLEQEQEAYGEQYIFAKRLVKDSRLLSWAREKMAEALSSETYGNMISYGKAESFIRNYKK